ncbi:hypothetical protein [Pseudoflavonifractor sp. 524-17]|uniref:hypothetical protein n=1 Tax=Pseudoflavonifractor sp. 524-17 TaxID=2304577 RepID=UPI00137B6B83|nr:hypothetical protein [Pseudoflavonifractor sp. 524-17]
MPFDKGVEGIGEAAKPLIYQGTPAFLRRLSQWSGYYSYAMGVHILSLKMVDISGLLADTPANVLPVYDF